MKYNFTSLFKDSVNFVRNQWRFAMQISLIYTLVTLISQLLLREYMPPALAGLLANGAPIPFENLSELQSPTQWLFVILFYLIATFLIYAVGFSRIHQISTQRVTSWGQLFSQLLPRLGGFFLIIVLLGIPLMMGFAQVVLGVVSQAVSFGGLFSLIIGLIIFVRFNLTPLDYLVSNRKFAESLRSQWILGIGQSGQLVLFCLINYLFFSYLGNLFLLIPHNNFVMLTIVTWLNAFISVFSWIFTYRFYSLFVNSKS